MVMSGIEGYGIDSCSLMTDNEEEEKQYCRPVPLVTLDEHFADIVKSKDRTIQVLKVDTEGWDYPVLLGGGKEMLRMTEYLEFEYHLAGVWQNHSLQTAVEALDAMGFTCYWAGANKLWQITGCWMDHYDGKFWSNLACAHRELVPALAERMERTFRNTIKVQ